jgi:hypothetical protein
MVRSSLLRSVLGLKRNWLAAILIIVFVSVLYSFSWAAREFRVISKPSTSDQAKTAEEKNKSVSYRGVSFKYSASLASDIKAETRPAHPLQLSSDTGQGIAPEHIAFQLVGTYASLHGSSFFSPEILVFPIEGYRQTLTKSQDYVKKFDRRLEELKNLLSERSASWNEEMPVLPFANGGSQCFHTRLEYVKFESGEGVIFLTQYNIEPALINNEGLTYTFQGLTEDQRFWVSATFPVSVPSLPQSYESTRTEDYTLVIPRSFRGHEYESFENGYRNYLDQLTRKLQSLPTSDFQPDLVMLKKLIQSLNIKPDPQRE